MNLQRTVSSYLAVIALIAVAVADAQAQANA